MSNRRTTAARTTRLRTTIHATPADFCDALEARGFMRDAENENTGWRRYGLPAADGRQRMTVAIDGNGDDYAVHLAAFAAGTYLIAWDVRFPGNTPTSVALAAIDAELHLD
jgi:hypothetical protein